MTMYLVGSRHGESNLRSYAGITGFIDEEKKVFVMVVGQGV